jgi:GlpG protein
MRCLGEIDGRKSTEQFVAFLLTQGITTHIDTGREGSDRWEVWVRDEDQLNQAKDLLDQFQANPSDAKYQQALRDAGRILNERNRKREAANNNVRRVKYRSGPLADRKVPPMTLTLVILCVAVSLLSNFGGPGKTNQIGRVIIGQLGFVAASDYEASNRDPAANLKKGQFWRAITPIFLHLSPLHLVFNMFGMIVFGRIAERWLGTPRYALLILAAAVFSNLLQGLSPEWMRGSPAFGGISGVVYCLFGYIWTRSSLNPSLGVMIPFPVVILLIAPIIIGFSGIAQNWNMADLAHLGGLVVGVVAAFIEERR